MIDVLVLGGIFREVLRGDTQPRRRYGGSGLVAAVTAARLGAQVALGSYVGDEDEEAVRSELRLAGVDDSHVLALLGASGTFVYPTRENSELPWPMYRPAESTSARPPGELPQATVIAVFGIPDYDPVAEHWLTDRHNDATLLWDRQGWLSRARDSSAVQALPQRRKVYLANEKEAMEDAKTGTLEEALSAQPPAGFEIAVIKGGRRGVTVVERSDDSRTKCFVPSFPIAVASTVGTGDVFAGALSAWLAQGGSPTEAARRACAASAAALRSGRNLLDADALAAISELLSGAPLS